MIIRSIDFTRNYHPSKLANVAAELIGAKAYLMSYKFRYEQLYRIKKAE
jgi:hypothetical protein